jgi:hypothetical protein
VAQAVRVNRRRLEEKVKWWLALLLVSALIVLTLLVLYMVQSHVRGL